MLLYISSTCDKGKATKTISSRSKNKNSNEDIIYTQIAKYFL